MSGVIEKTEEACGPVDALVNKAGIDIMKPFIDFTAEDFQKILNVNLSGNFHGMQAVLSSMQKAGGGSIVNISSMEGLRHGIRHVELFHGWSFRVRRRHHRDVALLTRETFAGSQHTKRPGHPVRGGRAALTRVRQFS